MDWRIKGIIQKALSVAPGGRALNSWLQLRSGGLSSFDANVDSKVVADWLVLADHMRVLSTPIADRSFLEIGTGWFPTLPVCFYLGGAKRCATYDLHRLLDFDLARRMVLRLERHLPAIATAAGCGEAAVRERFTAVAATTTLDAFLRCTGIDYHAPSDATATGLASNSVDVVFSNSVLEHVPAAVIDALMVETQRVLQRGGVAIHSVNCGDHYAYFDRSITQVHYLRFTEPAWRLWNNDLQYQNRLRANDFIASAERAGLRIVLNRQKPRAELLARFAELSIAPEFRRYSKEQLCTTSVDFVAAAAA